MTDENKKCTQYEGLFVFQDEEKLKAHLEVCSECAEEHEKHLKISALIKEAAPAYLARETKKREMRALQKKIACCLIVFAGLSAYTGSKVYDSYVYQSMQAQESAVSEMGLPVDKYGFLAI